jgi:hypothetical protein
LAAQPLNVDSLVKARFRIHLPKKGYADRRIGTLSVRLRLHLHRLMFFSRLLEIMSIVGEHMKRSHALALSGAALFLALSTPSFAQSVRPGQQCVPAVVDPTMYHNCRLRIVQGQEVCRCAIRPQALRQRLQDEDGTVTGSIGSRPVILPGSGSSGSGNSSVSTGGIAGGTLGSSVPKATAPDVAAPGTQVARVV